MAPFWQGSLWHRSHLAKIFGSTSPEKELIFSNFPHHKSFFNKIQKKKKITKQIVFLYPLGLYYKETKPTQKQISMQIRCGLCKIRIFIMQKERILLPTLGNIISSGHILLYIS